ncbi:response regulator transcription factor [Streptomyces montanisoli]|uniref:Response regulator transcription factor n=1 Tax=Streptomyces montanisoli TaxID=2798581 RepID=A0A940ME01_9ACTN|nr:response regulator transcription factor [Streptomyces montanisoli]MBP0458255.1 response regulator transcription factor [Streptomyces montanisoli]
MRRADVLRVVVADDNLVVRAGLTALLSDRDGIEVVAGAADGREAYEATVRTRPDVVLLDVRMPRYDGIAALPYLVRLAPVLMTTYSAEPATVQEALRLGAGGYLVHGEFTADQLVAAVRGVREGRPHLTPSASSAVLQALRGGAAPAPDSRPNSAPNPPPFPVSLQEQANVGHSSGLSGREVEIMDLIGSGMTNQQIAAACFISQKTVKNHINRIFAKLGAGSRGEAIARWHGTTGGGGGSRGHD